MSQKKGFGKMEEMEDREKGCQVFSVGHDPATAIVNSQPLSLPTLDLSKTGPVHSSISDLLLSVTYSALLSYTGELHLLFTPTSPQVIKVYHGIRAITSQKILLSIGIL